MRARIHIEERTSWPWWLHLLMVGLFIVLPVYLVLPDVLGRGSGEMSPPVAAGFFGVMVAIPFVFYLFMGQLRVRITDDGVDAAWGFVRVFKKHVPFSQIRRGEAVTYSPIREFGGWGIRMGLGKKRGWTVRGNRALVLHLSDGTHFYLTSQKPERLLVSLQSAGAGKMAEETETGGDDGG